MWNAHIVVGNIIRVSVHNDEDDYFIATAERHIPKCKNIINKPKPPPQLRDQQSHQWGPHYR